MWVLNGDCSKIYGNEEGWTGPDGTKYSGTWPKEAFPGFQQVIVTDQPEGTVNSRTVEMVNGVPTVVWDVTPPAPCDPAAEARNAALAEIVRLEHSITDRMWREDAVGSATVMEFGVDDPRTGKTATQYIGYVNSAIANIRAGL